MSTVESSLELADDEMSAEFLGVVHRAKKNAARLASCVGHKFVASSEEDLLRCVNCGGETDAVGALGSR